MTAETEKGLRRTYGYGAGEREYRPIPMARNRRRQPSRLYEAGHARYPQTGAYAAEEDDKKQGRPLAAHGSTGAS